jgi:hypothetical protein
MAAEEETMRFIGGTAPRDVAWRTMATIAGSWALLGFGFLSVIEKQSGRWIGRLGPWRPGGRRLWADARARARAGRLELHAGRLTEEAHQNGAASA